MHFCHKECWPLTPFHENFYCYHQAPQHQRAFADTQSRDFTVLIWTFLGLPKTGGVLSEDFWAIAKKISLNIKLDIVEQVRSSAVSSVLFVD